MTVTMQAETTADSTQTTSLIQADADGRFVVASGEFDELATVAAGTGLVTDMLCEFLGAFEAIDQISLARDRDHATRVLQQWQRPDGNALEGRLKAGGWRLLSSCPAPGGGMLFFSVAVDRQNRKSEFAEFMLDNAPLPVWANDADTGEVVYANPASTKLYGIRKDDNRRIAEFFPDPETNRELLRKLQHDGYISQHAVRSKSEDGKDIWVNGSASLSDYDGRQIVISAVHDVTDARAVEEDSRRARDILRDAINSLSEGFALYDDDSKLVMCNQRYKDMNRAVEDLLEPGLDWEILMRETARRGVYVDAIGREEMFVEERLANGIEYIQDFELNQTDGSSYLVSVHPTRLGGFVVTRTDITAKKQAEAVEREGDLLVRSVLEACPAAVVMARLGDGHIIYRSPAALEMFGRVQSAKEHYVSAEDRADYITRLLADGEVDDYKLNFINADGDEFPATTFGRLAEYKGEEVVVTTIIDLTEQNEADALIRRVLEACPVPIQMTKLETGQLLFRSPETTALFGPVETAKSYYAEKGARDAYIAKLRSQGWVNDLRAKFTNAKGRTFWGAISARLIEFKGEEVIVSNTRDLTEELEIQDELANQREMLFQNEKMSALGELLAGVAHELNNPLSIVVGHSLMLREEAGDAGTLRRIEKISNAAERCAKIVKTFLAMARQQPARMERMDIASVISTAVDVTGYGRQNEGLVINCDLPDDLPEIVADPDQITQVVINLVMNAEQAIIGSGVGDRIDVTARACKASDCVEVYVEDNGPGIPDKIKGRIFEPFFTTKEVGDGTGIGLAFCHRIIHSHEGRIWHDQDHQPGSRFGISLPVEANDSAEDQHEDATARSAGAKRVLVVDDEPDVGELIAEILKKEGFRVDRAGSGAEALELLSERAYDVLLSDLNMPEIDGGALYQRLRDEFPDTAERTAFITGDTMGAASQKLLQASQRPYLEKPVSPAELRELVYGLLSDGEIEK